MIKGTEDSRKVTQAVLNLFPSAKVEIREHQLIARTDNIDEFKDLLEKQRIRDTARAQLLKRTYDHGIIFRLNKQAAYFKKVNFSVIDHPLGEIKVDIQCEKPNELINHLTKKRNNDKEPK
jgi:predicted RNA binding protein with dsRBD fold (UPF0201 family)